MVHYRSGTAARRERACSCWVGEPETPGTILPVSPPLRTHRCDAKRRQGPCHRMKGGQSVYFTRLCRKEWAASKMNNASGMTPITGNCESVCIHFLHTELVKLPSTTSARRRTSSGRQSTRRPRSTNRNGRGGREHQAEADTGSESRRGDQESVFKGLGLRRSHAGDCHEPFLWCLLLGMIKFGIADRHGDMDSDDTGRICDDQLAMESSRCVSCVRS